MIDQPQIPFNGMVVAAGNLLIPYSSPEAPPGYVAVTSDHCVRRDELLDENLVHRLSKQQKSGIPYWVPTMYRAAAHAITHPNYVLTGFGALALYGLPSLVDGMDVVFSHRGVSKAQPPGAFQPRIVRGEVRNTHCWSVLCRGVAVMIACPELAVAQALKLIRRKQCEWPVTLAPGGDAVFVRAVQLVDAARRYLGLDTARLVEVCRQHVDARWLTAVVAASSPHADSPKETEMRFIAERLAEKYNLILEQQVTVWENGRPVTTFDLVLRDPKTGLRIGLMYDGAQHWEKKQRDKDATINLETTLQGWIPLRYSDGTLGFMYDQVSKLLNGALKRVG